MHAKIMALMCPLNGFLWITHERERSLLTIKFSAKKNIVGPNNLWAKPIYSWGIQRSKPRRAMAQAQ